MSGDYTNDLYNLHCCRGYPLPMEVPLGSSWYGEGGGGLDLALGRGSIAPKCVRCIILSPRMKCYFHDLGQFFTFF